MAKKTTFFPYYTVIKTSLLPEVPNILHLSFMQTMRTEVV